MTFGNPAFLWGLAALPLPILLHLFFRRRRSRIPFSTLQFFQPRKNYLAHRRRIREWLTLLLRTLALLALTLALARPRLHAGSLATRTNTIIILDDTLSMGRRTSSGESAFDWALKQCHSLLDTLRDGDAAALILISGKEGHALTRKRQLIRQHLEAAELTAASGSYATALQQASDFLATDPSPNQEIVIISDFPRSQAPTRPISLKNKSQPRLYLLPVAGTSENLALEPLKLSTRPPVVNQRLLIPFTIRNTGATLTSTQVELQIEGNTLQSRTLELPPHESISSTFEFVPDRAGTLRGSITLNDPQLLTDNTRHFLLAVCEHTRVMIAESEQLRHSSPYFFIRPALDPDPDTPLNGIRVESNFLRELSPQEFTAYHAIILANPQPLDARTATHLWHYLEGGGTLLIFAGPELTPTTFSTISDPRLGNLYGERVETNFTGMTFKNMLHPLSELLQMQMLTGQRLHQLTPSPSATILAESQGHPLLIHESIGHGNLIACALSGRRDYSNWPTLKSFPVTLLHLLTTLMQDASHLATLECGTPLKLQPETSSSTTATIHHSSGFHYSIDLNRENATTTFTHTWHPGTLQIEGALPRTIALNPVANESDLTPISYLRLNTISNLPTETLSSDATIASQLRAARRGSDLTGTLLALTLLLLLTEPLLSNNRLTRRTTTPATGRQPA